MAYNIEMNIVGTDGSYSQVYPKAYTAQTLETARTVRTNLASTSTASFDGSANITPGVTGTLSVANGGTGTTSLSTLASNLSSYLNIPSSSSFLPKTGGTLTGNLTIKGSSNYGTQLNLGDGDYVHISEPTDDCMEIKAKKINFLLSDTSTSQFTINDKSPFESSNSSGSNAGSIEMGTYVGNGTNVKISYTSKPKAIIITGNDSYHDNSTSIIFVSGAFYGFAGNVGNGSFVSTGTTPTFGSSSFTYEGYYYKTSGVTFYYLLLY